jgi:hypothetical protein
VKRPDAEELLAIRDGAWSFDKLMEHTDSSDASLEAAEASSPLPWGPDIRFLDNKLIDIISRTL